MGLRLGLLYVLIFLNKEHLFVEIRFDWIADQLIYFFLSKRSSSGLSWIGRGLDSFSRPRSVHRNWTRVAFRVAS